MIALIRGESKWLRGTLETSYGFTDKTKNRNIPISNYIQIYISKEKDIFK